MIGFGFFGSWVWAGVVGDMAGFAGWVCLDGVGPGGVGGGARVRCWGVLKGCETEPANSEKLGCTCA